MKIAHIVCTFPPYKGGMGNSVFQFVKVLAERNHDVAVFTPNYSGLAREEKSKEGFKIIRLTPWLKYGNGAFLPQLLWKLKGPRSKSGAGFDIVHLHYPFFGGAEAVWLAKILYGAEFKLVVHYHMDAVIRSLPQKIFSWPSRLIRDSLFKKAEAVTCASLDYIKHSEVNYLYEKYKNKFYEVPFGVDIDKFRPADKPKAEEKIILFVGGLDKAHYFKGVEILIKAFSELADGNCRLLIIGRGELREKYEKQAEELGVGRIEFISDVFSDSELAGYYQKADVFVLPSINKGEAFGMVLLEAMACAVPVIASNLPGVRNVFQNGVQGLLIEPGDADDLKNKMELMLSDNGKRREMGRAGRKLAEEKYSREKAGERMEEVYKHIHPLL
ncbi:glycosyltransferase family 4 protein [Patescibacteria group bacterium]|nr:glycosyltransferase family 4 protein [Patescibacteria group bacterium]